VLDCTVPEGSHILSLYFVNDHHYYEPNRRYTLEISAAKCPPVLADVDIFGGGVYKRFLVRGPAELRIRIRRDASMNVLLQGVFLDPAPARLPFPQFLAETGSDSDAGRQAWEAAEALRCRARFRDAEVAFGRFAAILCWELSSAELLDTAAALAVAEPAVLGACADVYRHPPGAGRSAVLWHALAPRLNADCIQSPAAFLRRLGRVFAVPDGRMPGTVRLQLLNAIASSAAVVPAAAWEGTAERLRSEGAFPEALAALEHIERDSLPKDRRAAVLLRMVGVSTDIGDADLIRGQIPL
jgi:hypothetical protein